MVKNAPTNAGVAGDPELIPGSDGSSGGGNDNPLQYSCLENPMDRGAWWVPVHMGLQRVRYDLATEHEHIKGGNPKLPDGIPVSRSPSGSSPQKRGTIG